MFLVVLLKPYPQVIMMINAGCQAAETKSCVEWKLKDCPFNYSHVAFRATHKVIVLIKSRASPDLIVFYDEKTSTDYRVGTKPVVSYAYFNPAYERN